MTFGEIGAQTPEELQNPETKKEEKKFNDLFDRISSDKYGNFSNIGRKNIHVYVSEENGAKSLHVDKFDIGGFFTRNSEMFRNFLDNNPGIKNILEKNQGKESKFQLNYYGNGRFDVVINTESGRQEILDLTPIETNQFLNDIESRYNQIIRINEGERRREIRKGRRYTNVIEQDKKETQRQLDEVEQKLA